VPAYAAGSGIAQREQIEVWLALGAKAFAEVVSHTALRAALIARLARIR
jgi:hypothetical protein